ncbi:hypothetical protein DOY81_002148 [Sarcophaga bullata]|nr:hypothetical protein DOY81_002148 [Sarcophaga bullata]
MLLLQFFLAFKKNLFCFTNIFFLLAFFLLQYFNKKLKFKFISFYFILIIKLFSKQNKYFLLILHSCWLVIIYFFIYILALLHSFSCDAFIATTTTTNKQQHNNACNNIKNTT